jgi:hypothetical protein
MGFDPFKPSIDTGMGWNVAAVIQGAFHYETDLFS